MTLKEKFHSFYIGTKSKSSKVFKLMGSHSAGIGLILGIAALGVSAYNTYQIKNIGEDFIASGQIAKAQAPEKILKELPKNIPYLGSPDAKVTIVEFGDFQCPFCGRFFNQVLPEIKKDYIDTGKVNIVYLDFAFLGQESKDAAEAAKCATEQGKFWEYHDELYKNQKGENLGTFNETALKKFASNINLDASQFETCISGTKYDKSIEEEQTLGRKYGVGATPSFLIGKNLIKGVSNVANFRQIIDLNLK